MADRFPKKVRSKIMSKIRSEGTSIEKMVFRELRKRNIYFQKHYKNALGTPDIALPSKKVAIFIDGDFWHGFRYPLWKKRLNSKFWTDKIERNRARDKRYHAKLRRDGWKVKRIWEHQLQNDFDGAIKIITNLLKK